MNKNTSHRWPGRDYREISDTWGNRIGVTTEPAGHDEDGNPLYEFYRSDTQEKKRLTEEELIEEIDRLKHPNNRP